MSATVPLRLKVWVLRGQPPVQVTLTVAPLVTPLTLSVENRVSRLRAFMK